jgi:signal transduction histidine kinase
MPGIVSWLTQIKEKRRELHSQAFLWIVVPLMVMLVIIFLINMYAYQQVIESLVKSRNQELARTAAAGLSQSIRAYSDILEALASTDEIRSDESQRQREALLLADRVLEIFDGGVFILNTQGVITASDQGHLGMIGRNLAIAPYFQNTRALKGSTFSDVVLDPTNSAQAIVLAAPIMSREEEFQGMVMGAFHLRSQQLGRELQELKLGEKGLAYIADRNGRIIFHTDYNAIGQNYNGQDAVGRLQHGDPGGAFLQDDEQPSPVVVGFARVQTTGWGLVIHEPWSEVIAPIQPYLRSTLIVLSLGFVLTTAFIFLNIRRVTAPIAALVKSTTRVARGDFSNRVQESNIKEIGELGRSFNFMLDQIARYRAGMRRYVAAITHSQEDERKRISRDLHDDTVQDLVAIGQRIDLCRVKFVEQEDITEDLKQVRQMVTETVKDVRQFSRDLRPLALEDLGLAASLQYLVAELADKMDVTLDVSGKGGKLPAELEVAIYRIVQEALQNVRKHAGASRVSVSVVFTEHNIEIQIRDDGRGFAVPETLSELTRDGSYGVMGIEERVRLFEGDFQIVSQPGQGTRVSVILPREIATNWDFPGE